MNKACLPWIQEGYATFAINGPQGLKVERLSKLVGKNKSSFYYHFADLNVFTELLLDYHLAQLDKMMKEEAICNSMEELVAVLMAHKLDLLFNRQLRIHREKDVFEACFLKTNQLTEASIPDIWPKMLGLEKNYYLAELVLKLSIENFFLQITASTLNEDWLTNYFRKLQELVKAFKR